VDSLPAAWLYAGGLGLLAVVVGAYAGRRRYQLCPHCRRVVPRAVRGWLRCRGCGRQYHRSVWWRR